MVYTKEASFPFPILNNNVYDYINNKFNLDVHLFQDNENYIYHFDYEIESNFIKNLINENRLELIGLIKSQDNSFCKLDKEQKIYIKKERIALKKNTKIQLALKAKEIILFNNCDELVPFFSEEKDFLEIPKNSLVGFSNVVIFEGSTTKPLDIFEKRVDSNIRSEIKIDISYETIDLIFKDEKYQFLEEAESKRLNYIYVYMGLQKVLMEMILESKNEDLILEIDNQSEVEMKKPIHRKIIKLLKNSNVSEISFENIDEVISKISSNIIKEFYEGVVLRGRKWR